jgi:N6-L-threonylcarbamoyladenine synthase
MLGIESSCDETAAAVVAGGSRILGSAVASSAALQSRHGGVVPELAARQHVAALPLVVEAAMAEAGVRPSEIDAVAVTQGPGLLGALLIGMTAAKSLALAWGRPLVGVHHLEAHLYANAVVAPVEHPSLALLVSGGHTGLFFWPDAETVTLLGETRDDAAGEAFDKGARVLGLGYPGGPAVQALAAEAHAGGPRLPVARTGDGLDFSFSGLKSALARAVPAPERLTRDERAGWAAALEEAVAAQVVDRLDRAYRRHPVTHVYAAGGVVANRHLRGRLDGWAAERGISMHVPPVALCTDNGVMVACAAAARWPGGRIGLDATPKTPWELSRVPAAAQPHAAPEAKRTEGT